MAENGAGNEGGGAGSNEGSEENFDIYSRKTQTKPNYRGVHHTIDEILEEGIATVTHSITCVGDYDELKLIFDDNKVGFSDSRGGASTPDSFVPQDNANYVIINKSLTRQSGGRGKCIFIVRGMKKGYTGGLDFESVTKDIHFWRQLCANNVPDLSAISLWERMKDDEATLALYYEFKYLSAGGEEKQLEEGTSTRTLAEMIARGVQSYMEYIPTLTTSYNFPAHPKNYISEFQAGALLGRICKSSDLTLPGHYSIPLGQDSANTSPVQDFEELYGGTGAIICTADQLRNNPDGTYTLTRGFSKYRAIEKELYMGGEGAAFGPYDEQNS